MVRRRNEIVVERLKSKEKGQINGLNVKHVLGNLSRAIKGTEVIVSLVPAAIGQRSLTYYSRNPHRGAERTGTPDLLTFCLWRMMFFDLVILQTRFERYSSLLLAKTRSIPFDS